MTESEVTVRSNADRLAEVSVLGEVAPPVSSGRWRVGPRGETTILPGVGGITYNCKVGDSATKWAVDHVEPGVSVKNDDSKANTALQLMACIGNVGRVTSGDAKGAEGVVTGKHGGIDHVLMDFPDDALQQMVIGDKIQIRARGLGLELDDAGDVRVMNLDPRLLALMGIEWDGDALRVPVARRVPAALMGSGIGREQSYSGDYDLQLFDAKMVEEYGLEDVGLGDIVAIENADHAYGRSYCTGAVSIGLVVHCCCTTAGHGPGVTSLMTSREGNIQPVLTDDANIASYLRIGRARGQ